MITTITLNVSVDKAYRIAGGIQPGTVSRVLECINTAGGKGLNVARIIDFCGEKVTAKRVRRRIQRKICGVSAGSGWNPS